MACTVVMKGFSGIRSSLQHVLRTAPTWENSGRGLMTTLAKNNGTGVTSTRPSTQKADGSGRLIETLNIGKSKKKKSKQKGKKLNQNGAVSRKQNSTINLLSTSEGKYIQGTKKTTTENVTTSKSWASKSNGSKSSFFSALNNMQEKGTKEPTSRASDKKKLKGQGLNLSQPQTPDIVKTTAQMIGSRNQDVHVKPSGVSDVAVTSNGSNPLHRTTRPSSASGSRSDVNQDRLSVVQNHTQFRKDMFFPFRMPGQWSDRASGVDAMDLDLKGDAWQGDGKIYNFSHKSSNASAKNYSHILGNHGKGKDTFGIKPFNSKMSSKDSSMSKDTDLPILNYEHLLYNERRYAKNSTNNINSRTTSDTSVTEANGKGSLMSSAQTSKPSNGFILVDSKPEKPSQTSPYGLSTTKNNTGKHDMDDLIQALRSLNWGRQVQEKLKLKGDVKTNSPSPAARSAGNPSFETSNTPSEKRLNDKGHTLMTPKDQMENYIFGARLGNKVRSNAGMSNVPNNSAQLSKASFVSELKPGVIGKKRASGTELFGVHCPPTSTKGGGGGHKTIFTSEPVLSVQPSEIINRKKQHPEGYDNKVNTPNTETHWSTGSLSPKIMRREGTPAVKRNNTFKTGDEVWASSSKLLELKKERKSKANKKSKSCKFGEKNDHNKNCSQWVDLKENGSSTKLDNNKPIRNGQDSDLVRELRQLWKEEFKEKFLLMQQNSSLKNKSKGLTFNPTVYSKKMSETPKKYQSPQSTRINGKDKTRRTPESWMDSEKKKAVSANENGNHGYVNATKHSASRQDKKDDLSDPFEEWINLKDEGMFQEWTYQKGDVCGTKSNSRTPPTRSYPVPDVPVASPRDVTAANSPVFWFDPRVDIVQDENYVNAKRREESSSGGKPKPQQNEHPVSFTKSRSVSSRMDTLDGLVTMTLQRIRDSPPLRRETKDKKKSDETRVPNSTNQGAPRPAENSLSKEEWRLQSYMLQLKKHQEKIKQRERRKEKKNK